MPNPISNLQSSANKICKTQNLFATDLPVWQDTSDFTSFPFLLCRYDYFERKLTPFMSQLKAEGTYTDYMMNIFVTKTFPNHHTMATGFYAETHGVVDNEFFDPIKDNLTKYSYELYHYNNNILPIWVRSETIIIFCIYFRRVLYSTNGFRRLMKKVAGIVAQ